MRPEVEDGARAAWKWDGGLEEWGLGNAPAAAKSNETFDVGVGLRGRVIKEVRRELVGPTQGFPVIPVVSVAKKKPSIKMYLQ